jgi:nucleotide-binding universal stress UspA family protein
MYRRILVPTDGSPLSRKAVDTAVALASSVGAEVLALNVVPRYPTSYFEGGASVSIQEVARIERQWSEQGQALAHAVEKAAQAAGVKARAITMQSDLVGECILAAARKYECDLVVMASHGHKGLKRLLLGSETQHVLTHGDLPVLVLH